VLDQPLQIFGKPSKNLFSRTDCYCECSNFKHRPHVKDCSVIEHHKIGRMWRERVYNGTLRPKSDEVITGEYLDDLLNGISMTVTTNHDSKLSEAHDVNLITPGLYLGDR
jgi:hypothetical protein